VDILTRKRPAEQPKETDIICLQYDDTLILLLSPLRRVLDSPKKEDTMGEQEVIVILDAGNGEDSVVGPESYCCIGAFGFIRG
jgi:hypothetical protein